MEPTKKDYEEMLAAIAARGLSVFDLHAYAIALDSIDSCEEMNNEADGNNEPRTTPIAVLMATMIESGSELMDDLMNEAIKVGGKLLPEKYPEAEIEAEMKRW